MIWPHDASAQDDVSAQEGQGVVYKLLPGESFRFVETTADGKYLISIDEQETVRIWNIADLHERENAQREPMATLQTGDQIGKASAIAVAKQGNHFALGFEDGSLAAVAIAGGEIVGSCKANVPSPVTRISISADGKTITAVSQDQAIHRWLLGTETMQTLRAHNWARVRALSNSGEYCAGSDRNHRVTVLQLGQRELVARERMPIEFPTSESDFLAFSPDDNYLHALTDDGVVWRFPVPGERPETMQPLGTITSHLWYRGTSDLLALAGRDEFATRLGTLTKSYVPEGASSVAYANGMVFYAHASELEMELEPQLILSNAPEFSDSSEPTAKTPTKLIEVFYATNRQSTQNDQSWLYHFFAFFQHGLSLLVTVVAASVIALCLISLAIVRRLTFARAAVLALPMLLILLGSAAFDAWLIARSGKYYGGRAGPLRWGTCPVEILETHLVGELDSGIQISDAGVFEDGPLTVLDRLRRRIAETQEKQAILFVHGFNVSFEDATRRTAQLAYDLSGETRVDNLQGDLITPICFTWPSRSDLLGYPFDSNSAELAAFQLSMVMKDIENQSGAKVVHVIAHSMGGRVLTGALRILGNEHLSAQDNIFREIILAAPDIDADLFVTSILPAICGDERRVTLYASAKDKALKASERFNGFPRAGDSSAGIVTFQGMDAIDVSDVDTSELGHSYYGDNRAVVDDIRRVVRGKSPSDRELIDQQGYWAFDIP